MTDSVFIEADQASVTDARPRLTFVGVCPDCTIPARLKIEDEKRDYTWGSCPDCDNGPKIRYERIYALVTMGSCDGRCMGAQGAICNCACGGDNHAGAWTKNIFKTDVRASYIEKLLAERKKTAERRVAREAKKREDAAAPFEEWKRSLWGDDADLVEWLSVYENVESNSFLVDMRLRMMPRPGKESKYPARPLTEKMFAACHKIRNSQRAFEERKRIESLTAKNVPVGRVEIAGEIVSQKIKEGEYDDRPVYKILVKCDGFKVWGSCPRDLVSRVFAPGEEITDKSGYTSRGYVRGLKIKLRATVKPSENDPSFGIYSRPSNAALVEDVPVIEYTEEQTTHAAPKPPVLLTCAVPNCPGEHWNVADMCDHSDETTDLQKHVAKTRPDVIGTKRTAWTGERVGQTGTIIRVNGITAAVLDWEDGTTGQYYTSHLMLPEHFTGEKIDTPFPLADGETLESVSESVSETPAVEKRPSVQSDAPAPVAKRSGSHSECQHEASKSARAKCRRERSQS